MDFFLVVVAAQRSSALVHCAKAFPTVCHDKHRGQRELLEPMFLLKISPAHFFRDKMRSVGIVA